MKACPFCGKTESVHFVKEPDGFGGAIICDASTGYPLASNLGGCGAKSGWAEFEKDAIAKWNSRPL